MLRDLLARVQAGCGGILLQTWEAADAVQELANSNAAKRWTVLTWNANERLRVARFPDGDEQTPPADAGDIPAAVVAAGRRQLETLARVPDTRTVLFIRNAHRFFPSVAAIEALVSGALSGASTGMAVVLLCPTGTKLPTELDKLYETVTHDLPDLESLKTAVLSVVDQAELDEAKTDLTQVADALRGLTREEARVAVGTSLVLHGKVVFPELWESKAAALRKAGLELSRDSILFADVAGSEGLKRYVLQMIQHSTDEVRANDFLLLGVPGAGKSSFAKALGNELGLPTILMSMSQFKSKYVGESEANLFRALQTINQCAPCVVLMDELEKMLSGSHSENGNSSDSSGVSSAQLGILLQWMQERKTRSYLIATANDIRSLPDALLRNERFGDVFFMDIPSPAEQELIWKLYCSKYGVTVSDALRQLKVNWTGADIKTACKKAVLMGTKSVDDVADLVLSLSDSRLETLTSLRQSVSGRALSATTGKVYQAGELPAPGTTSTGNGTSRRRTSRPGGGVNLN